MQIILQGRLLEFTQKTSARSRSLRVAVHRGGEVSVSIPVVLEKKMGREKSDQLVHAFLNEKSSWLFKAMDKMKALSPLPPKKSARESRAEYLKYKKVAKDLVSERLTYFNETYKFKYNKITIRNQKGRWGSCSRKGNLNFNYRIALLPLELADYIVVHELCHIGRMDHSKKFWDLVALCAPDFKEKRKRLKGQFSLL